MMPGSVFEGLKVCDFSWVVAGPLITRCLAAYGATVVLVESNKRPTVTRTALPYKDDVPGVDRAGYFTYYNCNKSGLSLDLNHPEATNVARKLVAWSDVVVANFSPGMMHRWGLDYEELRKVKPDIIMVEVSNQGQTGPYSKIASFGLHLVANAGFSQLIGWPDRDPLTMTVAWPDMIVPQFAIVALIAALERRRQTGEGQYIDVSQLEASLYFLAPPVLDYTVNSRQQVRAGNACEYAAPHGAYRCRGEDRWCAIAVFNDEEWHDLCQAMGGPVWTEDVRFTDLVGRKQNEDELNKLMEAWTINLTPEEVMTRLQAAGVNAGIIASMADLHKDPQLKHRGNFWVVDHPVQGRITTLGEPSILSRTPAQLRCPAPLLGQDTVYVCQELLGMSDEEFDKLVISGVFD